MKLVSENSDEEIAKEASLSQLRWLLSDLAANMLRVVRGAGKPFMLGSQMAAVLNEYERYREAAGHYPSDHDIGVMLDYSSRRDHREDDWSYAIDLIVRGSLQFAGSTMVGQSTQQAAGESELMRGVSEIEAIRAKNRAKATRFSSRSDAAARDAAGDMDARASTLARKTKKKPPQLD